MKAAFVSQHPRKIRSRIYPELHFLLVKRSNWLDFSWKLVYLRVQSIDFMLSYCKYVILFCRRICNKRRVRRYTYWSGLWPLVWFTTWGPLAAAPRVSVGRGFRLGRFGWRYPAGRNMFSSLITVLCYRESWFHYFLYWRIDCAPSIIRLPTRVYDPELYLARNHRRSFN